MNDDDDNSNNPNTSLKKICIACINELSLWKAVNSMKKTKEQKNIIKSILKDAKAECGRTVIEVVVWSETGETRNVYYRALKGNLPDEAMICMFMAVHAAASLFDQYCKACGIWITNEYEYGKIIRNYIFENDRNYDVLELDEKLRKAGQPSILKDKAA